LSIINGKETLTNKRGLIAKIVRAWHRRVTPKSFATMFRTCQDVQSSDSD